MSLLTSLGGFRVVESPLCQNRVQFRFPKSKKKRIRAKWEKREENVRYVPTAYRAADGVMYFHPTIAANLRMKHHL